MKLYLLKLSSERLEQFAQFIATYNIEVLFTYQKEDLFSTYVFAFVTTRECDRVTSEEKDRLINETGFKIQSVKNI